MRRSGHLFAWQGHKRRLLTHVTHDEDQELLALPFRGCCDSLVGSWTSETGLNAMISPEISPGHQVLAPCP